MNLDAETRPSPMADPARLATGIRLKAAEMIAPQGFGYLGQALSAAEQLAAVFSVLDWDRDKFVCSPGHYIIAPYAAAGALGLLAQEDLGSYGQNGSRLEAIGTESSPIVDYTCGSLGQGLSAAAGFALANKLRGSTGRVYALVSDGEMEEGQTWEAAIFAAHHQLGQLTVLLDANNSQVDGPVDSITTLEPIADKWRAFGWHVLDIDGHDITAVSAALAEAALEARPSVIVCRTSTVHGLDCLPEDADGHFIKLPPQLATEAIAELTRKLETR
ncbi:1-deoxy-D-xylulose-5-phosphate synthase N-terminal domain-containing protein [Arthrobacter sp. MA-N2]|uniref:1-deoxy-D-xylulose-5-phosphate synthase N-terminal domain-containing protein n=1 Tax=Arthrobacter sp. MA-N2 TaxID=1101188 RepID=UPI0009E086F3|nr:1-deoxy-D-xylulose-5-phosphate synthase N-terminal domain-containing protein [Arthrobacter sp. MA-N2]